MRGILATALLIACAFGQGGGAAPAFGQAEAPPPRIARIRFPGAEQVSGDALREVMRLRQKSWWQPFRRNYYYGTDHLGRDLERVLARYRTDGYLFARIAEVQVRYLSREWVELEIRVEEGVRVHVRSARVSGLPTALGAAGTEERRLPRGAPLRAAALERAGQRLERRCREAGYALAEITREVRVRADSADVRWWVAGGPRVRVGAIEVRGTERTRESVVRREIQLARGDLFRRSAAVAAQERLFDLDLFRTVRLAPIYRDTLGPLPGEQEVEIDLAVTVAEKPPGWYGFGFGVSSADQVRLLGEWGYRNLMGRGHALAAGVLVAYSLEQGRELRVSGVKERQLELTYTAPWLFRTPLRWQLATYYRFNREPTLEEDIYSVAIGAQRSLSRYARLVGSVENKWIATTDTTAGRDRYETRFLTLSWIADHRDFVLDPRRGRFLQLRGEYAGGFLGGAASFARGVASGSRYLPLRRSLTMAARLRAGVINPIGKGISGAGEDRDLLRVPFDERFRAGGGTTVRGYAEKSLGPASGDGQPLGGLVLLLVNLELRWDLIGPLGGAVFLDAGSVWEDYRQLTAERLTRAWTRAVHDARDLAYGTGVGLRWETPIGPLRLDYGFKLSRARAAGTGAGEWHFSLGQAF